MLRIIKVWKWSQNATVVKSEKKNHSSGTNEKKRIASNKEVIFYYCFIFFNFGRFYGQNMGEINQIIGFGLKKTKALLNQCRGRIVN